MSNPDPSLFAARREHRACDRCRGFSLVEILIALVSGLFILLGLTGVFSIVRQNVQAGLDLADLQDRQRLTMQLLATMVQQAGYFPDALTMSATDALPAAAPFGAAGQSVYGEPAGASPESLAIRFVAPPSGSAAGDYLLTCQGGRPTSAAQVQVNTFSVNARQELTCAVNGGAALTLATGVLALSVLYGADTQGSGSVSRYLDAGSMTAGLWRSVSAVRLTLSFVNPLATQPGQPASLSLSRTIALPGRS